MNHDLNPMDDSKEEKEATIESSLLKEMKFMRENFFEPINLTFIEKIERFDKSQDQGFSETDRRASLILLGIY